MATARNSALGQRSKSDYAKKLVGIVVVTVGEKKARFELVEDGKRFAGDKETLTVNLEDLPAFPKLTQAHTGKQFRIRMNSEGDTVEALTPVTGHYTAKLIDLGPRPEKDADPTPKERVFDEGGPKEERHLEFFAVYKITSGAFKGVQMPAYYLHYKFEKDEDGTTRFAGNLENPKATRLHQLFNWGDVHGLWKETIKWDNVTILPVLLERALDNDIAVELIVKDGYIKDVLPVQDDDEFVEEPKVMPVRSVEELKAELAGETLPDPDEAFKKPAKKPAKKVVDEEEDDL